MKVLWISSHGGNYKDSVVRGTGGWVGALQKYLVDYNKEIELGICFPHSSDTEPIIDRNVTYYPILSQTGSSIVTKLYHRFFRKDNKIKRKMIEDILEVISSFNPDIIHIWGIENDYAEIIPLIEEIPIIVHIQGLASAISYAYCPPYFSLKDIYGAKSLVTYIKYGGEKARYNNFLKRANRELKVSRYVKNWIGRTDWDKSLSKLLSPSSEYYHCDEMMRPTFNSSRKWRYHYDNNTIRIQSNISEDWYKGIDVVLKTAKTLNDKGIRIEWKVFGWKRNSVILNTIVNKLKIIPEDVGVKCCGSVDANSIREELLSCDVYVHPSYIENSSNAIAEAQLLGVPVIAQYVGGNPTMLRDNSGRLVQPNDPNLMAASIIETIEKGYSEFYSKNAIAVAEERQNIEYIMVDLLSAYNTVINNNHK